ncbi:MAG: hydrolase [Clostridium sp.]|nr:hydrolase [Clostridium sp.]
MAAVTLMITNAAGISFFPPTVEGIQLAYSRRGSPGTLKFTVLKDRAMADLGGFAEGSAVTLQVDGKQLFYGFIFMKRRNKAGAIECTAYDQIRYLKNKDILSYKNMTAAEVVKMIANDKNLQLGEMEATAYVIPMRTESETTLLDMIETALDLELAHQGQMFVLYDDFGRLTLQNIANMRLDLLISPSAAENFDYTSSIDEQTYNQIKLAYANKESGKWETYIAKDSEHINLWGLLQYFDTLEADENGQAKAKALLSLYNSKTRKLKIQGALGDVRVRAGCLVGVALDLGDIVANTYMLVEKATHTFRENEHFMDLTLRGGEFVAG